MIAREDFEQLMNSARIRLVGASDSGIKAELYDVLQEFFTDSNSWRTHQHLLVSTGTQEYELAADDGGRIVRLLGVWDGNRIPVAAFMPEPPTIQVRFPIQVSSVEPASPSLSASNPWLVATIENIKRPTTREDIPIAPAWVLQLYTETILDGLLGRMMSQASKSYSNDTKSQYHLRRFRTGIQLARTAAARQNAVGAQTWAYPRGWQSTTQRGGMVSAFPPETF